MRRTVAVAVLLLILSIGDVFPANSEPASAEPRGGEIHLKLDRRNIAEARRSRMAVLNSPGVASFVDPLNGWIANNRTLLVTTDGGGHWDRLPNLPGGRSATASTLQFVSRSIGFVAIVNDGKGGVARTDNGGRTWRWTALRTTDFVAGMDFGDADHGWAKVLTLGLGGGVHFLRTGDGGRTWGKVTSPCSPNGESSLLEPFDVIPGEIAWVACAEPDGSGDHLHRTDDSGHSWKDVAGELPGPAAGARLQFLDARRGLLLTAPAPEPAAFATSDGGASWRRLGASEKDVVSLSALVLGDERTAYVQTGDAYFGTRDGGDTWRQLYPPVAAPGTPACRAADLRARLSLHALTVSFAGILQLTNISERACVLRDPVRLSLVDARGRNLGLTTSPHGGPPLRTLVQPGGAAGSLVVLPVDACQHPTPEKLRGRLFIRSAGLDAPVLVDREFETSCFDASVGPLGSLGAPTNPS